MSDEQSAPVCYRHRNRETYLRCVRCDKPICADCRIDAPVGFQCPGCVAEGRKSMRKTRSAFGGRASTAFGGSSAGAAGTVTKVLIGLNVAMFILTLAVGGTAAITSSTQLHYALAEASVFQYGQGVFHTFANVELFGTMYSLPGVSTGGEYRMVTAMFLHFGAVHLLFNMVVLWILGRVLEKDLGSLRFLAVYLVSGLVGSVAVYVFTNPITLTAGASGAVYGLFGVLILVNRRLGRESSGIYVLLGINLVLTVVMGFSLAGHVGGLVGGLLCGAVLAFTPASQRKVLHWVGFAVILAMMVVLTMWRTDTLLTQFGVA
ncbi:rhomboid family intramembrane serine protease [Glycomyces buryatensis]|uniref:Rhomboid family intramembrane serine protease n=1 Tax=Glycomyces buryatensis TaxID=2570927 RepID=A0A4S8QAU5_9ACTN|nr:rhomboid family intramembrane serine protease [Glycomyces buryatensis]THV41597.1 rhomboid family intramembrane serine protease [Glycomyces buryatensis]